MLAGARHYFLLFSLLVFSAAVCLPVQSQINGVPASVTSMGFGGKPINGVPASVTSLGPNNGYGSNWSVFGNCCTNFFLPSYSSLNTGNHHHHKDRDSVVGVIEPVYVPYAVADGQDDDADSVDAGSGAGAGPRTPDASIKRRSGPDSSPKNASAVAEPDEAADPVATQPATVLVFRDGHKSDVTNYAIVGDTLFDFEDGRTRKILLADLDLPATHKANDDRGVDFQIPAGTKGQ